MSRPLRVHVTRSARDHPRPTPSLSPGFLHPLRGPDHNSNPNSASASAPGTTGSSGSDILPARNDSLTAPPRRVSRSRGSIAPVSFTPEDDPLSMAPMLEGDSRRKSPNYLTHEGCMEGESAGYHEGLSSTSSSRALLGRTQSVFPLYRCAPVSTCCPAPPDVSQTRADSSCRRTRPRDQIRFVQARHGERHTITSTGPTSSLARPSPLSRFNPKAMLARSKVLITLATHYQPPKVATLSLREAVGLLRDLSRLAPRSVFAREKRLPRAARCSARPRTTRTTRSTSPTRRGTAMSGAWRERHSR